MKKKHTFTLQELAHIAELAKIPLTKNESDNLKNQITVTVDYISQLQSLQTNTVIETSQVTGLENVFREDDIDSVRMFTQEQALFNAKRTHNGFVVVDAIFNND